MKRVQGKVADFMSLETTARATLRQAHRLVVKVGTHVVTNEESELATGRVTDLVLGLAGERKAGREVVLVTSGAVGMGMRLLGLRQRPRSLGLRQACAAVGQGRLMAAYAEAFGKQGLIAAQVLLTQEDLGDRDRALCVRTTLMRLLELGAVPVLNENDSVSIRELVEYQRRLGADPPTRVFGDNDGLSAHVAVALDAATTLLALNRLWQLGLSRQRLMQLGLSLGADVPVFQLSIDINRALPSYMKTTLIISPRCVC